MTRISGGVHTGVLWPTCHWRVFVTDDPFSMRREGKVGWQGDKGDVKF